MAIESMNDRVLPMNNWIVLINKKLLWGKCSRLFTAFVCTGLNIF